MGSCALIKEVAQLAAHKRMKTASLRAHLNVLGGRRHNALWGKMLHSGDVILQGSLLHKYMSGCIPREMRTLLCRHHNAAAEHFFFKVSQRDKKRKRKGKA